MAYYHLSIGTATNQVNLLSEVGWHIKGWTPQAIDHEGIFGSSSLADGRQLRAYRNLTVIDTFDLVLDARNQDRAIRGTQDLRRVCRAALDYWANRYNDDPVYLIAQASCETNRRYALVHDARLPNDDNPYGQPFLQPRNRSTMDNMTLLVEHGPWLANVPGTGTCVEAAGYQSFCFPSYLEFDGASAWDVDFGSAATLDDLPDFAVAGKGIITAEAWVRATGYGNNFGRILDKRNAGGTTGWRLFVSNGSGLCATTENAAQDAISYSGLDEFNADSEWHHVVMVYDETGAGTPAARTIYLAIGGVWVVSYPTQQASIGNYGSDAGDTLYAGADVAHAQTWEGDIGWVRVSDSIRYDPAAGTFTPPVRCELPDTDVNTMLLAIYEGEGATAHDLSGNASDGTITGATWDCDCSENVGNVDSAGTIVPVCTDTVYIANKHNYAQLTNVYWYDIGAPAPWSANLINQAAPYTLLPAVPAFNDFVIFGIDTATVDSGPFCSLVFDISTAIVQVTTIAWEYWNGGWVALAVQDNTNAAGAHTGVAFDTTGVHSVHWIQPTDWAAIDLVTAVAAGSPAVTGYWVRARVTAIGAAPTSPIQQNRAIYTVTWPFVEVEADQVTGDIPALARLRLHSWSDADYVASTAPILPVDVAHVGLRSLSRGADFTAYINMADEQNPTGITVTEDDATTSFTDDILYSPTGRAIRFQPGGVLASREVIQITFTSAMFAQYYGIYRVFLRVRQVGGAAGDMYAQLRMQQGPSLNIAYYIGQDAYTRIITVPHLIDCGRVELPVGGVSSAESYFSAILHISLANDNAAATDLYLYDIIFIPVDEWAGTFITTLAGGVAELGGDRSPFRRDLLDLDSISYPKEPISAQVREAQGDTLLYPWQRQVNGPLILHENTLQRYWILLDDDIYLGNNYYAYGHSVQAYNVARYLSMRGDR